MGSDMPRRRLFGWVGAAGAGGVAAGAFGGHLVGDQHDDAKTGVTGGRPDDAYDRADSRPGGLPQGLDARVPAFGQVLAVDLAPDVRQSADRSRRAARALVDVWARIADDTSVGDVVGRDVYPSGLQVAYGVGTSLLRACGLDDRRPEALVELPLFATDKLDDERTGGDLVVHIGAEDPLRLAAAAQQVTAGLGRGARVRWSRRGFRQTLAATRDLGRTPRNLMGHRDGTNNPEVGSPLWDSVVRATESSGPTEWMNGGSYLVVRDIRIDLDDWFQEPLEDRDAVIGRSTETGAPLGSRHEQAPVNLERRDSSGAPVIPAGAHIRRASSTNTSGSRIYRRSWNYDDGWSSDGHRDAGLLFLAWQADPRRGFVPIQQSLSGGGDALNRYTTHIGSAVFAMLPQPEPGGSPLAILLES